MYLSVFSLCGEGELKHEKQHLLERMDLIRCRKAYVSIDDDGENMCVLKKARVVVIY